MTGSRNNIAQGTNAGGFMLENHSTPDSLISPIRQPASIRQERKQERRGGPIERKRIVPVRSAKGCVELDA